MNTIGEDMDIIMKLHKKMRDEKRKYKIKFLADPICWTQVPESLKDLRVQRRRWQIGLFDSLLNYKSMVFNPKYGSVGVVVLPYYWLFELIGPVVEFLGYLFIPLAYLFGLLELNSFLIFLLVAFLLGTALSMGSILLEQISFRKRTTFWGIMRLVLFAFIENLGYRQLTVLFRIEGILKIRSGRHSWGTIKRQGFDEAKEHSA